MEEGNTSSCQRREEYHFLNVKETFTVASMHLKLKIHGEDGDNIACTLLILAFMSVVISENLFSRLLPLLTSLMTRPLRVQLRMQHRQASS